MRAAVGCRAHTGWAGLVVIADGPARRDVALRARIELADPTGRVRPNVYQRSRALAATDASARVATAERIAAEQAAAELERTVREAREGGASVRSCAVVVGSLAAETPLESILASHALCHAAEGRLYQQALLDGAEACGLDAVAVPRASIWDEACWTLGLSAEELRQWLAETGRENGPPWAEDQKLAAVAALVALAGAD
jgi:hypothetical protein